MPIDATVESLNDVQKSLLTDAIIFYAGCAPTFHNLPNGNVRITAVGYYEAVGA